MSEERKRTEHPSWCDPEACTAPEFQLTREEYIGGGGNGRHRSKTLIADKYRPSDGAHIYLYQLIAPWQCTTYLGIQIGEGEYPDVISTEVGDGGAGFGLYELLGQEVKDAVRQYPALFAERFPDVQRAIEDEADEATADAAMPRDPVELEERMTAEAVADEEREAKGCTHPADEPCFGRMTRPVVEPRFEPHEDPTLPPQLRAALKRMGERGKVVELSSSRAMPGQGYKVTVNARELAEGTLPEAKAAIADFVTRRLAAAPERLAGEAQTLNLAFSSGVVEDDIAERGQWFTVFDAYGEDPLRIMLTKEG